MTQPGRPVKPPKHKNRLEQLIGQYASAQGLAAGRVRNRVSFMVFAGAVERAALPDGSPTFWFKGGLTMEARPCRAHRASPPTLNAVAGSPSARLRNRKAG